MPGVPLKEFFESGLQLSVLTETERLSSFSMFFTKNSNSNKINKNTLLIVLPLILHITTVLFQPAYIYQRISIVTDENDYENKIFLIFRN